MDIDKILKAASIFKKVADGTTAPIPLPSPGGGAEQLDVNDRPKVENKTVDDIVHESGLGPWTPGADLSTNIQPDPNAPLFANYLNPALAKLGYPKASINISVNSDGSVSVSGIDSNTLFGTPTMADWKGKVAAALSKAAISDPRPSNLVSGYQYY